MARPESEKTIVKRRKALHQELNISKRLLEEARTKSADDPKAFAEYLTVDIYIESMLSTDIDVRRKAAKDMLAYSLAKKKSAVLGQGEGEGKPKFEPTIPARKEPDPLPPEVQQKIHSIQSAISQ